MTVVPNFSAPVDGLVVGPDGASLAGVPIRSLAEAYGTPLFVYDGGAMRTTYRRLAAAVRGFAAVCYSIKANPNPWVARIFADEGARLEIASGAEFLAARQAGASPGRILFAGPGKGEAELRLAIEAGIGEIHLETFEEIDTVARLAAENGRVQPVSIRVNPIAAVQGGAMRMGGKPAAFGFDEEVLADVAAAVRRHPSLELCGVHLFAGTQILDAGVLLAQWAHGLEIASRLADIMGAPVRAIDLGGGLGIPYHEGDKALDLAAVAAGVPALIERARGDARIRDAEIVLEPGRYLTGPSGLYVARVRAVKTSRESRFVITDGGMHHHLAASGNLGQVIKRDYPILADADPAAPLSAAVLVGPLCTPLDTLGRTAKLPDLAAGDLVIVRQSGAYGLTASPVGFLSHPTPAEVLVEDGKARLIRPAGSFDQPFAGPLPVS